MRRLFCGALLLAITATAQAAKGNAEHGRNLYAAMCAGCHSVDYNGVGPAHQGVFGRRAGQAKDYVYSLALSRSSVVWNESNLDKWLTNPEKLIPGQQMGFSVANANDRADLIAYLKTLSHIGGTP